MSKTSRNTTEENEPSPCRLKWPVRVLSGRSGTGYLVAGVLVVLVAAVILALSLPGNVSGVEEKARIAAMDTVRAKGKADSALRPPAPDTALAGTSDRDDVAQADNTEVADAPEEVAEVVGEGRASYYGASLAGNPTASGEPFDPAKLTAAHRTLPLGSRVRVTNLRNDESITVRINDRGPYHGRRILDLSRRAAEHLGMIARGETRVKIELLEE